MLLAIFVAWRGHNSGTILALGSVRWPTSAITLRDSISAQPAAAVHSFLAAAITILHFKTSAVLRF